MRKHVRMRAHIHTSTLKSTHRRYVWRLIRLGQFDILQWTIILRGQYWFHKWSMVDNDREVMNGLVMCLNYINGCLRFGSFVHCFFFKAT